MDELTGIKRTIRNIEGDFIECDGKCASDECVCPVDDE